MSKTNYILNIPVEHNSSTYVAPVQYVEPISFPEEVIQAAAQAGVTPQQYLEALAKAAEHQAKQGVVSQGKSKTPEEKAVSDKLTEKQQKKEEQLKLLEQKEQADAIADEVMSGLLSLTMPSTYINGGLSLLGQQPLNVAESLGVDLLTYIALGGLAGLVKQGAVKLTKTDIQKTPKFAAISARATVSDKAKALRGNWNPEFKLNTGKPMGPVDYESKVIPIRNRLIEWYYSPDYKQRLKQVGLSDAQADERIQQLIANTHVKVLDGKLNPDEFGVTSINLENQIPVSITIDGSQLANDANFNSTVLEELIHASELNGFTIQDLIQDHTFATLPKQQQELLLDNITKLHNDVAYHYNRGMKPQAINVLRLEQLMIDNSSNPKLMQDALNKMSYADKQRYLVDCANYYYDTSESRARAIGSILNDPKLSTEWDQIWINTLQKEMFRKSVLTAPLIVT